MNKKEIGKMFYGVLEGTIPGITWKYEDKLKEVLQTEKER
jgi:hypothetical protein